MKNAVDVIEQVFFAKRLAGVSTLEMRQACISDSITATQTSINWLSKKVVTRSLGYFIVNVEREALCASVGLQLGRAIHNQSKLAYLGGALLNHD